MARIFALFALLLAALPAAALEITKRPDLAPRLSSLQSLYSGNWGARPDTFANATIFHLSGPIRVGDTDRVKAALETTWGKFIVIDSPGGSFLEGIKLGRYLQSIYESQDPDLYGVFVLKDAPCLSACALAVALTTSTRDIEYGVDSRYIEHGATLGFHMGLLPEAQATQNVQAREMMNLTYDITGVYTSLIMGGVAPPVLLAEALQHREANSFFTLRGGARTHAMRLTPIGPPHMAKAITDAGLTMRTVEQMCFTAFVTAAKVSKSFVDYEFGIVNSTTESQDISLADLTAQLGSRRIATSHNGAAHCLVERRDDRSVGMRISTGPMPCEPRRPSAWCAAPADLGTLPDASVALLADSHGCHSGKLTRQAAFWSNDLNGVTTDPYTIDWSTTIARDVNMRSAPSLSGEKLGGLRAGDPITITDCAIVDGPQGVWYKIDTGGRTGWISARFAKADYVVYATRPLQDGP